MATFIVEIEIMAGRTAVPTEITVVASDRESAQEAAIDEVEACSLVHRHVLKIQRQPTF